MPAGSSGPVWIPIVGGVLALLFLFLSMRFTRRRRLLENLPTSKVQGVFIGLVELKGTAEVEAPLTSYLAASRCVWYEWSVEEHWSRTVTETYTDSDGNVRTRTRHESGWKTVASGGEHIPFYLKDDTGVIQVLPENAKVEPVRVFHEICGRGDPLYYGKGPAHAVADSDHRRQFTESAIPLHKELYIVGKARERRDVVAAEIAYDRDAAMYLISTRSEEAVTSSMRLWGWVCWLAAVVLWVAGWMIFDSQAGVELKERVPFYLLMALACFGVWVVGWIWMVFNSLVNLRQRVNQAWSLVDVQLKRRHDLIPRLVNVVTGLRDHEQKVQEQLAKMRSQMEVTAPGEKGPDPEGCLPVLRGIVEAYPELKAQESFLKLQEQLADTEQRIALARSYFNTIATHYRSRLEVVPDGWIARLGGMKPRELITATSFERAPVKVSLAS